MTGTFGGALETRGISASDGRLRSSTVGEIESDGGTLVIRRIRVTYHLSAEHDADRSVIDRVLQVHAGGCPVYRSLHPQIEITASLDLETAD
ncbi:MAG TPA: hypothetical protein QGG47_10290 [Acidobacteriota bacterium]|nr:hypothetical protein [Acidobacteriota bacterium]